MAIIDTPREDLPDLDELRQALQSKLRSIEGTTLTEMASAGGNVMQYPPTLQLFLESLPSDLQSAVLNAFLVSAIEELKRRDQAHD